jgi:hypothetical protein
MAVSFRIEQVTSGTLQKWNSSQSTWENVAAGITTVSAGERLQWKAKADANGIGLNAFTVKAIDAAGATSSTAIQVNADVTAVNDAPTLSTFSNPIQTGFKDFAVTLTFNDLFNKGNENDVDGTVVGFIITEVTKGTFVWNAGDAVVNSVDVIKDFSAWNGTRGDKLDIKNLLTGYTSGTSTLSQWVTIATAQIAPGGTTANSTKITIDIDGAAGAGTTTQTIWLDGVNLTLNGTTLDQQLSALRTNGILIA